MPFSVPFYVHPTAAITAGLSVVGNQTIEVNDDDLAMLQPLERLELATALHLKQRIGESPYALDAKYETKGRDLEAAAPTIEELQRLLANRVLERKRFDDFYAAMMVEETKRMEAERAADLRRQEEEAVRKHEAERVAVAQRRTLEKWIVEYGDDNQKARHKEGLLPEEEVLVAVTEHVFDDLEANERYSSIKIEEVCRCECADDVKFVKGPGPLSAKEYEHLTELRSEMPKGTAVEIVRHEGKCPSCDCEAVVRCSADLTLAWHGFTLKRRYLL